MSMTTVIKTTLMYQDGATRTYSIETPATPDPIQVKARVTAFNAAAATGTSDVNKTFVSDFGNPVTLIKETEIVTTTEEVLYNG